MIPSPGAANAVVPKNGMGMAFWIAGVPGRADMVKVKAPSAIVPGIRRFGMSVLRNRAAAIGKTAKATTNADTPPYVSTAQQSTTETIARSGPNQALTDRAIDFAQPLSSISLPKMAPSMKQRKEGDDEITHVDHEYLRISSKYGQIARQ